MASGGVSGDEPFVHQADRFFDRDEVEESLRRLATSTNLVAFAGAGLTVDMTGVTWASTQEAIRFLEILEEYASPLRTQWCGQL